VAVHDKEGTKEEIKPEQAGDKRYPGAKDVLGRDNLKGAYPEIQ